MTTPSTPSPLKGHRIVTGIKPTGTPHLGNYVGAIGPALQLASAEESLKPLYFIADLHALNALPDPHALANSIYEVAATWLACGLDPKKVIFFCQSDIPEVTQIATILASHTRKGAMNMAHAYKAAVDQNSETQRDPDSGINMGLFNYPILMAADVLSFQGSLVPVGKDQQQHIELMRDIAGRFNQAHGEGFALPEALISEKTSILLGLDGRKMSKSYNNTIPLFCPESKLKKLVNQIKTDSSLPGEPKDPENSPLFTIYSSFATVEQIQRMRNLYGEGIAWKDAKEALFALLNTFLTPYRLQYDLLIQDKSSLDHLLKEGASEARQIAATTLAKVKKLIGVYR